MKEVTPCIKSLQLKVKSDLLLRVFNQLSLNAEGYTSDVETDVPTEHKDPFDDQIEQLFMDEIGYKKVYDRDVSVFEEIKSYLSVLTMSTPSEFFKKDQKRYPNLYRLADVLHGIPSYIGIVQIQFLNCWTKFEQKNGKQ